MPTYAVASAGKNVVNVVKLRAGKSKQKVGFFEGFDTFANRINHTNQII